MNSNEEWPNDDSDPNGGIAMFLIITIGGTILTIILIGILLEFIPK